MEPLLHIPVTLLAILIFLLRIVDVSLGTLRTISVVHGRVRLSVVLGFFEVLVWVTAVSQVITRLDESLWLAVAYAGGFAAGNAVGIALEKRLKLGSVVVRIITATRGDEIARSLRAAGQTVTTFAGEGDTGARTLIYLACSRRDLPDRIERAQRVDPDLFYAVERFSMMGDRPLPDYTGWRAVFKRK